MFQSNFEGNSLSRQILFSTVTFLFLISANATCQAQQPVIFELDIDVFATTWRGDSSRDWFVDPRSGQRNWLGLPSEPDEDVLRDRLVGIFLLPREEPLSPAEFFLPANAFDLVDSVTVDREPVDREPIELSHIHI